MESEVEKQDWDKSIKQEEEEEEDIVCVCACTADGYQGQWSTQGT